MKNKIIFIIIIGWLIFFPLVTQAQNESATNDYETITTIEPTAEIQTLATPLKAVVFRAKVLEILEEKNIERENGSWGVSQKLSLKIISGDQKNQEVVYNGLNKFDILNTHKYQPKDQLIIQQITYSDNSVEYIIMDYDRQNIIYWLTALFILIIIIIGGRKGWRSIVGLLVSFFIIIKLLLPLILNGFNPLLIALVGSGLILTMIIYINEGWGRKSHLAILSVFLTLSITLILAVIFSSLAKLTGLNQEESLFLIGATKIPIDFKGLLLAGFLIGAVGVLDDIIIGQIEAVKQLKLANPLMSAKEIFKSANQIGNTHLGAIINTLFLTYAGASLPLLLLFSLQLEPAMTFSQIISNELVATEIIRTLVGTIGVAMSLPISTWLATHWLKVKK